MLESGRPEFQWDEPMTLAEAEGKVPATGKRGKRICRVCELECRKKEWSDFTDDQRASNPHYCTSGQVWRDMKSSTKGELWNNTA
eukprot:2102582-Prorocentrum_lima.AAC.1